MRRLDETLTCPRAVTDQEQVRRGQVIANASDTRSRCSNAPPREPKGDCSSGWDAEMCDGRGSSGHHLAGTVVDVCGNAAASRGRRSFCVGAWAASVGPSVPKWIVNASSAAVQLPARGAEDYLPEIGVTTRSQVPTFLILVSPHFGA
jgi:hypothetical protein